VLNLGAGLGASTRAIAKAFDVWIEGLEANSTLAKLAAERSVKAGMGERAMVRHYDPEALDLQEGRYDAIFSREALFVVADKKGLFEGLRDALKADGQLLFTDFVLTEPGAEDAAVKAWQDNEAEAPILWAIQQVTEALTSLGLEVRISEDISDRYQRVVQEEWARLLDMVRRNELPRRLRNYLNEAAELERYRMAALGGGSLRVYRFHTYK
jgi:cyclopropane fatty-acyl-phospholipid synthase-like methyltransferase